jgi:hypothetical protein
MASNFRIQVQKKNENLHLRLEGDFDGASAFTLIRSIGKNGSKKGTVFIHTKGLRDVHPFGREVFLRNLASCGERLHFVFTGQKGSLIAPQGHRVSSE